MSLEVKINEAIKASMKAKTEGRTRALRDIKAQILLLKTDGSGLEVTEDREMKLLQRMVKQREESLSIYTEQNRPELADKEREELAVIREFLPQPLSAEELEAALQAIIAEVGATSPKDMGKVMGVANQKLQGKAEGKAISEVVKRLLAPK